MLNIRTIVSILFTLLCCNQGWCQNDTIFIKFSDIPYSLFYEINDSVKDIKETVLLYDKGLGKIHEITNFKKNNNYTLIDLGNNFIEGVFKGFIDKSEQNEIVVKYEKNKPLALLSSSRIFNFNIDSDEQIFVPIKFNWAVDSKKFRDEELSLYRKDTNQFINNYKAVFLKNKVCIDSLYINLSAGAYEGNIDLEYGDLVFKQPVQINVKHGFWYVFLFFIASFIISYVIRFFTINEEKAHAYTRAKRLLKQVKQSDMNEEDKMKFIILLRNHIFEINSWLRDSVYYETKFKNILDELAKLSENGIKLIRMADLDNPIKFLEFLSYGVKAMHLAVTMIFSLLAFYSIYCTDPIFGAAFLYDYLKLFVSVLVIVIGAKGLLKDRIGMLKSEVG